MIKKLFTLENVFSLRKAAMIIGGLTLLSRITGFARSSLFASFLGPGDTLDTYYAAFRIPDLVFNLLILGTISAAFIPTFIELLQTDKERAYKVANSILNFSLLSMTVICGVIFLFAPQFVRLIVPGFEGIKHENTVFLTRLLLLSPIIFTFSNVTSSILNSQKKFLMVSLAPIFYNLGIIFGFLFLYPKYGLAGWGIGVLLGALLHVLIQIPQSRSLGFIYRPILDLKDPAIKKIGRLFVPRIFGIDLTNISLIIATIIGSTLASGSISIFNLANDLQAVPLGIFAFSLSLASFPILSELYAQKNFVKFYQTLAKSISQILFFMIPITVITLLFRAYIVRLGFGRGEFNWDHTILTFSTLGMFSFSLFSQSLTPLLARAFYAQQNTKIPVIVNAVAMLINGIASFVLAKTFDLGVVGLAAGFSIASIFNTLCLFSIQRHKLHQYAPEIVHEFDTLIFTPIYKTLLSSIALGLVSYICLYLIAPLVNTDTAIGILVQSGLASILGVLAFLFVAVKLKLQEVNFILRFFKYKNEA